MRLKKIVSGILACAMVVTSVFVGDVSVVKAAEQPTPIASYDFNDGLGEGVTALTTGLNAYTGTPDMSATGRSGADGDKAVKLGEYGLELPNKNLGSDYSVSLWVQPQADLENFSPILFLGYHDPELWMGIAGAWNSAEGCILWGGSAGITGAMEPKFDAKMNEWAMLTITQSGGTVSVYKNGELVKTLTGIKEVLKGENQSIYVGVNNWDAEFPGLVDDVNVYNQALTAKQVLQLYYGKTAGEMFEEEGVAIPAKHTMYVGDTWKVPVTLPPLVENEDVKISYNITGQTPVSPNEPSENNFINLAADGTITAKAIGTTSVTTSVVFGEGENAITKTQETSIEVKAEAERDETVIADYDLSYIDNGKIKDVSGNNNDAIVEGASGISFVVENGEAVMKLASNDSYLKLPSSIMESLTNKEQFTIETTFAKSASCGNNAWLFCLGSKVQSTGTNYLFLSPNFESKALRAGIKNSSTEKLFSTSIQTAADTWYTVNMVFDQGTIKLYWNGVLIKGTDGDKLESGYSIMDDVVTPGTENNILGYIGKSCWAPDSNYQGKISSFKIYNKAMTDEEVQLSKPEYLETLKKTLEEGLSVEDILGSNYSASEVKYNLSLPTALGETALTWSCDPADAISGKGVVKNGASDQQVTLTATLKSGALEATKDFNLTIKALDASALQSRIAAANTLKEEVQKLDESVQAILNMDALNSAIDRANTAITASSQTDVDSADKALERAMDNIYPTEWADPFASINASKAGQTVTMEPGAEETLIEIPDKIKGMVTVTYTSSDESIADVDKVTGVVTAKKAGYSKITTTVTAKSDDFEMEYQTLVKVDFDFSEVSAEAEKSSIAAGETTGIKVTLPEGLNLTPTLSGQAENEFVSVEEKDGKVTITGVAEGTGSVTIIVRAGGKMKAFQIPVEVTKGSAPTEPDLSGVTASAAATSIVQGSTTKINVNYPADVQAANPVASYKASGAVSVDTNGTVTGNSVGEGTVVVTVTAGGKSRVLPSIKITVTKKQDDNQGGSQGGNQGGSQGGQEDTTVNISKAKIKAKATKIAKGKTTTISITYPNTATKAAAKVTYKASGAVSVSKAGKVKGKKAGKGTVTVTIKASGQKTVTKKITVNVGDINGKSSVKVKKSITLKVKGISGKVKWSVNKKKLASISSKGKLKAKKAGKVKVTAKVGKVTMTKTITIKK